MYNYLKYIYNYINPLTGNAPDASYFGILLCLSPDGLHVQLTH
jgi:hypothetical protein